VPVLPFSSLIFELPHFRNSETEDFLTLDDLKQEATVRRGGEVRGRISGYILQIMDDVIAYRAHIPADGTW
jgi:hypothetical protein